MINQFFPGLSYLEAVLLCLDRAEAGLSKVLVGYTTAIVLNSAQDNSDARLVIIFIELSWDSHEPLDIVFGYQLGLKARLVASYQAQAPQALVLVVNTIEFVYRRIGGKTIEFVLQKTEGEASYQSTNPPGSFSPGVKHYRVSCLCIIKD